ncbi:serine hydrolase domain-containing protein [Streptomyces sp. NPDC088762]|uniref:serine hydrolase domain-containing protein n=1 Tax=Streptomyces sp. NPDC088762 TaxID=3365891 RepID=UPI0037FB83A4
MSATPPAPKAKPAPPPEPIPKPAPTAPRASRRALRAAAAALLLFLTTGAASASSATATPARTAAVTTAVRHDGDTRHGAVGQDLDPATAARLDAAITAAMKKDGIPGVIVGLWMAGRGDYVKSFGVADRESGTPMKSGLHMRIGSVTKTFTVTALLQLVDQGRVGLDDPVSRYVDGVPGGDKITLRQLAAMRSGLYDYTSDQKFLDSLRTDPQRSYTPRQLLGLAFSHPPNFTPGARWQYSNTNTVLLGLVVEKTGGQPLHTFLQQHVFGPLKLTSTSLPTGTQFPEPHAQGYTNFTPTGALTESTTWNPSWAWAAGAVISDLDDLHAWVPALADGRLLTPATQAERLRTETVGVPGISYGLGIADVNGWLGHNGELPGYETVAAQLPQQKATLVILINSDVDRGGSYSTTIGRAITQVVTPDHLWNLPSPSQVGENQH